MQHITSADIIASLQTVIDPELGYNIYDLGLIYKIEQPTSSTIVITMTLTTIGCPLYPTINTDMIHALLKLGYTLEEITIDLVFDPPWTIDKLAPYIKAELGYM